MTIAQLASRVRKLEKQIEELHRKSRNGNWWTARAGAFSGDRVYAEIAKEGSRYRKSQKAKA